MFPFVLSVYHKASMDMIEFHSVNTVELHRIIMLDFIFNCA